MNYNEDTAIERVRLHLTKKDPAFLRLGSDIGAARMNIIIHRLKSSLPPSWIEDEARMTKKLPQLLEDLGYDSTMRKEILKLSWREISLFNIHAFKILDEQVALPDSKDGAIVSDFYNSAMFATKEDIKKIDDAIAELQGQRRR